MLTPMPETVFDLIIAGGGPAGLSLSAALADAPLRLALIDRTPESELAAPLYDGREIALTLASMRRLRELGVWELFPAGAIAPLVRAKVLNGGSPYALSFANPRRGEDLGALVPNSLIRKALFERVKAQANCALLTGRAVTQIRAGTQAAAVTLADGETLTARLAVAADTRFSQLRQAQGISARMLDFGRAMLTCRIEHERPHDAIATEWFGHGQTIAMLPLNGDVSSYILTLPSREMEALRTMEPVAFAADAERRTEGRWGAMKLAGTRHVYPLVAVYADRFVAPRFALVGDAAVGMHPVTAHGYNFGLRGADALAREIVRSVRARGDAGHLAGLLRYEAGHRLATLPLFEATNAIARLYSDDRPLPRAARAAGLRLMNAAFPVRRAVEAILSR
jgi:ubiquinone biosynthesis UbiH/UbiF/VisC/COQ6 family hydroxylase